MAMNQMNQFELQLQFLQNQINQLQNQMNQMPVNQMNQMQLSFLQMQINNLQNQLNQIGMQQMNPINNFNQMNNNFGMNFNNTNNMVNLNNNFNNISQQPIFFNNNMPMEFSPFGIPQNGFSPAFLPQQNIMMEENYYVTFTFYPNGRKILCKISADSSIENMIQIVKNKTSIELKYCTFLYKAAKIDIKSQLKIKELFHNNFNQNIIVCDPRSPYCSIINFNSSSGIKTQVKYYGCLCCSRFWDLLQVYLREIGLHESCLKDLKFIFNGNILPNDKNEAKKYSSVKYGINPGSTITVIDTKNLIGKNK